LTVFHGVVPLKTEPGLVEQVGPKGVGPAQYDVLPAKENFVPKTRQRSVTSGRICDVGLGKHAAAINLVSWAQRMVNAQTKLVVRPGARGLVHEVGKARPVWIWESRHHFLTHRVQTGDMVSWYRIPHQDNGSSILATCGTGEK